MPGMKGLSCRAGGFVVFEAESAVGDHRVDQVMHLQEVTAVRIHMFVQEIQHILVQSQYVDILQFRYVGRSGQWLCPQQFLG